MAKTNETLQRRTRPGNRGDQASSSSEQPPKKKPKNSNSAVQPQAQSNSKVIQRGKKVATDHKIIDKKKRKIGESWVETSTGDTLTAGGSAKVTLLKLDDQGTRDIMCQCGVVLDSNNKGECIRGGRGVESKGVESKRKFSQHSATP